MGFEIAIDLGIKDPQNLWNMLIDLGHAEKHKSAAKKHAQQRKLRNTRTISARENGTTKKGKSGRVALLGVQWMASMKAFFGHPRTPLCGGVYEWLIGGLLVVY